MSTASDKPFPFPTAASHEPLPETEKPVDIAPTEDALDAGVEESFPASDPVSVTVSKVPDAVDGEKKDRR